MSYDLNDFEEDVIRRSNEIPVLVDFWAPWCGPCKMLTPVLEGLAEKANGRWAFVKVNTEEHQALALEYNIASIPNVKLFHQGEVKDEFLGALPESEIERWLQKSLPSVHAEELSTAQRLFDQQEFDQAAAITTEIMASEPTNEEARILNGKILLTTNPDEVEDCLKAIHLDSDFSDQAVALRSLAKFAALAAHSETLADGKGRQPFTQAIQAIANGDFDAALQSLIATLEVDNAYHQEGAKEAGKAIFQLLGIRHPIADKYYRAFSSQLYS